MNLRVIIFSLSLCFLLSQCSSKSSENPKNMIPQVVVEEIQQLDSLSQQLEKNTLDIEKSIQSVESALSELDKLD